jgi:TRAP-type C4-dicarboxylate transport system permease small subunit
MNRSPSLVRRPVQVFVTGIEALLVAAFVLLTLDVLWGVFSRYVLGHQSRWTEELAIYLLVWVSLIGASVTYRERGHLGVDYFVGKLDPAAQRLAAVASDLAVLGFALFALVYGGGVLITKTLSTGQVSPALGIEVGYLYLAAPISGVCFALFSVEHLVDLLRRVPDPDASNEH